MTEAISFIDGQDVSKVSKVQDEIIREGVKQRFEYTHELAWKVMKDYADFQGNTNIGGSGDTIRDPFQMNLMTDGDIWMQMIGSRTKSSLTYNRI